ncbi:ABC transporter substrate-binding protein [Ancylobacter mangrovi]|uniref:ABC transporter substrate-binding protein n=1 Tax=Ancylobacter mangrovi TaxID=2972472 RepID=UPI0035A94B48
MFKTVLSHTSAACLWCALTLALLVGSVLADAATAEPTQYPLTLENCGQKVVIDQAPKRVVSLGQAQTEILYALGLGDRMVATAVWFSPVAKPYEAVNAKVKRLADNDPSFEAVVGQEPDLVVAMYEWHIGPNGIVGKRDRFDAVKVPVYVSPTDCIGKDNTGAGDGVRTEPYSMDQLYQNIQEYGAIFDVADRAETLIASLKQREADALREVAGLQAKNISMMMWFSSKDIKGDAFLAGKNGVPAYIMSKLSARNIITTNEEWPLVGWETVAANDPDVLILVRMDRRRFPADDLDAKLNFLATDPVASQLSAVRNKRIVVVDVGSTRPGMDAIDGIEAIAKAVHGFGLAN